MQTHDGFNEYTLRRGSGNQDDLADRAERNESKCPRIDIGARADQSHIDEIGFGIANAMVSK